MPRNPRRGEPFDIALRRSDSLSPSELDEIWSITDRYVGRAVMRRRRPASSDSSIFWRSNADPDVRFFETANPGHRDGDMLVCLVPLSPWTLGRAVGGAIVKRLAKPKREDSRS